MTAPLRSILAATDLGTGSDAVVRSAAVLAARTGAELHLLHSLELPYEPAQDVMRRSGFFGQVEAAEEALRAQAERTLPEGLRAASQQVIIYVAHKAVLDRAQEVSADLIVVGPHRGGAVGAHFLGTTADRVIRSAAVPCLVVEEPLTGRIRRIGVPVDYSDPAPGALETALAWALQLSPEGAPGSEGTPEVRAMYAGWFVEKVDIPDLEERVIRPELERQVRRAVSCVPGAERLDVGVEVIWAENATAATVRWAEESGVDLLVMATHGRSGLRRALIGSMASNVARLTPRPVLLVPPALWSGQAHAPRLERVMIATDFSDSSLEAARWSVRSLAPEAEHVIVHVLEVPEPGGVLAGQFGSREELLRTARAGAEARLEAVRRGLLEERPAEGTLRTEVHEGRPVDEIARLADDVDLLVMGEHGRSEVKRGAWTMLGTTVERVLRASPAPVLVARGDPQNPPRNLLVAMDESAASLRALSWADFLRTRFGGSLTVLHVEMPAVAGYSGTALMGNEAAFAASQDPALEQSWVRRREEWLRDQVHRAGIDPDTLSIRVVIGSPAAEIVAEQESTGADLILMGTHGRGGLARALLGSVTSAVLRTASCSVMVVAEPERAST